MGYRGGGPALDREATDIINYLNGHPGYNAAWDQFRREHGDMADLGNIVQQAISAAQGVTLAQRTLDYFGGGWDSAGNLGSFQQFTAATLALARGGAGASVPSAPNGSVPGGSETPAPGSTAPIGSALPAPFGSLIGLIEKHPILTAGAVLGALMVFRRKR